MVRTVFWWPHARIRQFAVESHVVVALPRSGTVRWGIDGWQAVRETSAEETGPGFYAAPLNTAGLLSGQQVNFTIRWDSGDWIGADFNLGVS
jgi:glucoamylase